MGLRPEVTVVGQEVEDDIELLVHDVEDDDDGVVLLPLTEHGPSSDWLGEWSSGRSSACI